MASTFMNKLKASVSISTLLMSGPILDPLLLLLLCSPIPGPVHPSSPILMHYWTTLSGTRKHREIRKKGGGARALAIPQIAPNHIHYIN